jgi:DNA-binding LacI/PurR family transcriptional regulator
MMRDGAKIVLVDRTMRNLRCPAVTTDNVQVGRIATEHLISLGHGRIGHLSGDASSVSTDRLEGYRRALEHHGVRFDKSLIRPCGLLESEGYLAMGKWLARGDIPPAIFAVNDPAAIGCMKALEEAGLEIGKDVAIVGAGNIHYGDMLRVPLTTVSWSRSEMGQHAARLLLREMTGEESPPKDRNVSLPPELVVRNSCGAKPLARMRSATAARLIRRS